MWSYLWNNLLYYPFINLLMILYALFGRNLGVAVVFMAIILRLIMLPLTRKQTDMTVKMGDLKPRLEKLQKKYKNNPEQLAKEQMKLYKEVGYNPLGCLFSFVPQIFVFMAIIAVIRAVAGGDYSGLYTPVQDWVFGAGDPSVNTTFLWWDLSTNYQDVVAEYGYWSVSSISYFVLAVLVGVAQFFSTKFTQLIQQGGKKSTKKKDKKKDEPMSQEEMQQQMSKTMMMMFPFMTFSATLGAPAVLGVYWLVQVLMLTVQYFITNRDKAIVAWQEMFWGKKKK